MEWLRSVPKDIRSICVSYFWVHSDYQRGVLVFHINLKLFLFQFSPDDNGQLLAVSSWEGTVRIYHFPAGPVTALEKRVYTHAKPVLACTFFVSYFTFDLSQICIIDLARSNLTML